MNKISTSSQMFARARRDMYELSVLDAVQFYFVVGFFMWDDNDCRTVLTESEALDCAIVLFREQIESGGYRAVKYSYDEHAKQRGPPLIDLRESLDELETRIRAAYLDPDIDVVDFGFQMSLEYIESEAKNKVRYEEIRRSASNG
jgi:hypothetical protein